MSKDPLLGSIQVQGLTKTYLSRERAGLFRSRARAVEALKGIDLDIQRGEIFGLLGPNGAGKTTLIKCLTTLLIPTSGAALVNGYDVTRDEDAVRASIGCMLMGERGLYWKLTGRENLDFFAALYLVPVAARPGRVQAVIDLLNLGAIADRAVETYSSGQKMMTAFGKALVHDAPILILDEPTNTLDVPSARELRRIVRDLNRAGRTVVYTTHVMSEAEELCDRVAIIDRGQVIALGTVDKLKRSLDQTGVTRVLGVIPDAAYAAIKSLPEVAEAALTTTDGRSEMVVVSGQPRAALPAVIRTLFDHGAIIEDVSPAHVTLEDVFIAKTGRTLAEDTRVQ